MRQVITALLLAATAATPVFAQPASPGEIRRDRQELRQDRRDVRQQQREVRRDIYRGDYGEARRDLNQLRDDRRELRDSRRELRADLRGDDDRRSGREGVARFGNERRYDERRFDRDGRRWDDGRRFGNGRFDGDRRIGDGRFGRGWDGGWRSDRRYDWQRYRQANRRFYTLPRYYAPSGFGYGYRRFGVGLRLGAPFYSDGYWIADPWAYRLPPAYGPYRWVRYYDDVLLVDIRTGLIRDVIHGFFF